MSPGPGHSSSLRTLQFANPRPRFAISAAAGHRERKAIGAPASLTTSHTNLLHLLDFGGNSSLRTYGPAGSSATRTQMYLGSRLCHVGLAHLGRQGGGLGTSCFWTGQTRYGWPRRRFPRRRRGNYTTEERTRENGSSGATAQQRSAIIAPLHAARSRTRQDRSESPDSCHGSPHYLATSLSISVTSVTALPSNRKITSSICSRSVPCLTI